MGCLGSGDIFCAFVPQRYRIKTGKKMFTGAKQNRGNGDVHLVDQTSLKVLANRMNAATQPHILTLGCRLGLGQGRVNLLGDKVKGGAALHDDRRA